MNEVSNLFVCLMGMGTTFVGLICIIFLTMLMGKVMQKLEKPEPPKAAPAPAAPSTTPRIVASSSVTHGSVGVNRTQLVLPSIS